MEVKSILDKETTIAFKANESNPLLIEFDNENQEIRIIEKYSDTHLRVELKGRKFDVKLLQIDNDKKELVLKVDGDIIKVKQEDEYDALLKSLGMGSGVVKKVNDIKAPMPGVVVDIKVKVGQTIEIDQPLVVLEAMKMENMLKSPIEGVVKGIAITNGDTVEKNKVLITFE